MSFQRYADGQKTDRHAHHNAPLPYRGLTMVAWLLLKFLRYVSTVLLGRLHCGNAPVSPLKSVVLGTRATLLITPPPVQGCQVLRSACLSVCMYVHYVHIWPRAYLRNHTSIKLHPIFGTCCLWPWLGPGNTSAALPICHKLHISAFVNVLLFVSTVKFWTNWPRFFACGSVMIIQLAWDWKTRSYGYC